MSKLALQLLPAHQLRRLIVNVDFGLLDMANIGQCIAAARKHHEQGPRCSAPQQLLLGIADAALRS